MQTQIKKPPSKKPLEFFKPKPNAEQQKLQSEHKQRQEQGQGVSQAQMQAIEQSSMICFCGNPGCRIGEFVEDKSAKKKAGYL